MRLKLKWKENESGNKIQSAMLPRPTVSSNGRNDAWMQCCVAEAAPAQADLPAPRPPPRTTGPASSSISACPLPFPEGCQGKSEMPCRNTTQVARGSWINSYLFNGWKEASETHVKNLVYPYIKIQTFQHEISILKWIVRCSACWLPGFILKPCAACAQHFSTWTSHVWRIQKPHD